MNAGWHAMHVFIGARAHGDALVLVADRVIRAHASDPSNWFFIRYGEAGAHLRLRLGPGTHTAEDVLRDTLSTEASLLNRQSPDPEWTARAGYRDVHGRLFVPGDVVAINYEPEVQRYGGRSAIGVSEELFCHSSAIAVRAVALTPGFTARLGVAIDLLLASAAAAVVAHGDAAALLAGYARGWSRLLAAADEPIAIDAMTKRRLRNRFCALRNALTVDAPLDSLGAHWAAALRTTIDRYESLAARGELVTPWSGAQVDSTTMVRAMGDLVLSQAHMLANRLGYSPYDELRWSRYLATALQ